MHRREVLDALTAAVHAEDPVCILVTGDLVHVGLPEEIEAAAGWLRELGPPERVMLVPGNHDVYARDSWPAVAAAWAPYLGVSGSAGHGEARFPTVRRLGDAARPLALIGASSAQPSPLFMAWGSLGTDQLERLDTALSGAGAFRCLLIHHPPLPAMTSRRKGLRDAGALQALLARRGAELVLHGHVHRDVAALGPGGARVYGTASASSAGGKAAAAYRSFDVTATAQGWQVEMRLVGVTADGVTTVRERDAWTAPALTPPASAASAGR